MLMLCAVITYLVNQAQVLQPRSVHMEPHGAYIHSAAAAPPRLLLSLLLQLLLLLLL